MPSFSQVHIIGNLGRDPEVKYTPSGKAVANFSVAINDGTQDNPHTSWVAVTAWDKTAERMATMQKGDCVDAVGRLREECWVTQGGEKRSRLGVVASLVFPVAVAKSDAGGSGEHVERRRDPAPVSQMSQPEPEPEQNLPF